MDILYFGYSCGPDAFKNEKLESEFIEGFKEAFPNTRIEDAYDSIKGYRRSVYYEDHQKDEYLTWIIGNGWVNVSFSFQVMMMDENNRAELQRLLGLAKEKYPAAFKPNIT